MTKDMSLALAKYLRRHPDEREGLAGLILQIKDDRSLFERSNMKGHVTSSMFILTPDLSCAILIHHIAMDRWLQPGGHYERPGSLLDSAIREGVEETGLDAEPLMAAPIDIDSHPIPANPAKGEGDHVHHDFCYLGVARDMSTLMAQIEEVHGVKLVPLEDVATSQDPRLARMARRTMALRDVLRTAHAPHGGLPS